MFCGRNILIAAVSILLVQEFSIAASINSTNERDKRQASRCPGKFECKNSHCVKQFDICDGTVNCGDGSDEWQATCIKHNIKCPKGSFRCAYGACVDSVKKCDGVRDCADNSDELLLSCPGVKWLNGNYPECRGDEFQCRNGQCIDKYSVCDGTTDCTDQSDETVTQCNNENFGCPKNSFQCAYGGCVDQSARCNRRFDCADGSDEDEALCGTSPPAGRPTLKPLQPSASVPQQTTPIELALPTARPTPRPTPRPTQPPPTRPPVTASSKDCLVPSFPNTEYVLATCENNCQLRPNDVVNGVAVVNIVCKEPYIKPDSVIDYMFCFNGIWRPENHACVQTCDPLISPTLVSTCTLKGEKVPCTGRIRPGTLVRHQCQAGYTERGGLPLVDNECLPTGKWLRVARQSCTYRCGVVQTESGPDNSPLISYGEQANILYHPWNAGLYTRGDSSNYEHICGGTLITPYLILTAAHCLHRRTGQQRDPARMKIGLAKYYRTFNDPRDKDAQLMDVERIIVSEIYEGADLHYNYDLGIIEMKNTVRLSQYVMPACLATDSNFRLTSDMLGTVVGWGLTEDNLPSPTLQKARLPYYTQADCRDKLQQIAQNAQSTYISRDKFCAFYTNGTNVQQGDSGEGITFEFSGRQYVFGVVSTQVEHKVSTFTDLTNQLHKRFIEDVLLSIRNKYKL
ncbi:modular serine protease isoform X2 [Nilaparvata lugens]|uniref:modular serine protease isoform X1 n=1 Tax=Nilaparvata lugens TaxID=108931 RepID=UPI00193DBCEB|nr:modular serine protease isoform X1 [Nilaparvata lugens]XP_039282615.1 modular serine protease isoform X2 [Nilaparvata lugens]